MATKPYILYDNRFADGVPEATDAATGYDAINILDMRPYKLWKAVGPGTKYLTVYCGSSKSADTLAIIRHNLYSADADVSVESSTDGLAWTERKAAFTPTSDRAFSVTFTTASAAYWRVKIVTAGTAAYCGVVYLGSRTDFPRFARADFDPGQTKINAETSRAVGGDILGTVVNRYDTTISADFDYLTPTWVDGTFTPAWENHIRYLYPFFWVWEPSARPSEVWYAKVPDDFVLNMPYKSNNTRSLSLRMEGIRE